MLLMGPEILRHTEEPFAQTKNYPTQQSQDFETLLWFEPMLWFSSSKTGILD